MQVKANTNPHKSVLITGATSGIGYYAVKVLAQRGWIVWAGYRNLIGKSKLLKIKSSLIHPVKIDVTNQQLINKSCETIQKSKIPLHALINNAGVAFGGPIELLDMRQLQKAFNINFFGSIRMIQTFLPLLRETKGRIINISSISGLIGIPYLVPTSSSKFALEGMSDSLRREVERQGIKVSIIQPSIIDTGIWNKSINLSLELLKDKNRRLDLYRSSTDNLLNLFKKYKKPFAPLSSIKNPLIHASESNYPKRRYLVYKHSFLIKLFVNFTPEWLKDCLFKKVL